MQTLPTKFESILRSDELTFGPLIVSVEADLRRFRRAARFNDAQGAGSLVVIESPPGRGKTTAVYAASVLLRELFNAVVPVPPMISIDLRELPKWLAEALPAPSNKVTPVLIDGRESTDDAQGLRDVMGTLNNLVRGRSDLLFVWPTTSADWAKELVTSARAFGGTSFCPEQNVFAIDGPASTQWVEVVSLLLDQLGSTWDEFGVNESTAASMSKDYGTLGEFFTAINQIRIDQEDFAEAATGLPEVVFVVSSHSEVVGHVARLRNPATYRVRTDELISSARQSEAGKFWQARGAAQKSNLAWVASLLRVKLFSLTPSTVAHACALEADAGSRLADVMAAQEFSGGRGAGKTAYKTTDLARFLAGNPVPEVLTRNKGKTSDVTVAAFDAIQALSSRQHRDINKAILGFASKADGSFDADEVQYEVSLGGDAIADAIVPVADRRLHFEFHHLSGASCKPNHIATYVMKKLRVYGTQYNLIER